MLSEFYIFLAFWKHLSIFDCKEWHYLDDRLSSVTLYNQECSNLFKTQVKSYQLKKGKAPAHMKAIPYDYCNTVLVRASLVRKAWLQQYILYYRRCSELHLAIFPNQVFWQLIYIN